MQDNSNKHRMTTSIKNPKNNNNNNVQYLIVSLLINQKYKHKQVAVNL